MLHIYLSMNATQPFTTEDQIMRRRYQSNGTVIERKSRTGDVEPSAYCLEAAWAALLLNKAADLHDARQDTQSAHTRYQAEHLPGFAWIESP
jgi:hypothetical protein